MSRRHRRRSPDHPVAKHRAILRRFGESMEAGVLPYARMLFVQHLRDVVLPAKRRLEEGGQTRLLRIPPSVYACDETCSHGPAVAEGASPSE